MDLCPYPPHSLFQGPRTERSDRTLEDVFSYITTRWQCIAPEQLEVGRDNKPEKPPWVDDELLVKHQQRSQYHAQQNKPQGAKRTNPGQRGVLGSNSNSVFWSLCQLEHINLPLSASASAFSFDQRGEECLLGEETETGMENDHCQ